MAPLVIPRSYDEFSDPDLIRVGDDYYLTGTTMHAFPDLAITVTGLGTESQVSLAALDMNTDPRKFLYIKPGTLRPRARLLQSGFNQP